MKLPDIPDTGVTYLPRGWFKQLRAYLQAITPMPGGDIFPEMRPGGTSYWIQGRSGSTAAAWTHPYKGFDASEGAVPKVKIQIGTHNSMLPKIDGTALAFDTEANVLTLGEEAQMVYVQLDLNSAGDIDEATIHSSNDMEPPENTDATAYDVLFYVAVSITSGVARVQIQPAVTAVRGYRKCGANHSFWGNV